MKNNIVIVRGGGDIATGTIYKLIKCGYRVLVLETAHPSAIRRNVAFSEAVYEGSQTVEGMTAYCVKTLTEAYHIMEQGSPAVLVDEKAECVESIKPCVVVDAILAKRNLGTHRDMAPVTVALGPGFTAGVDVDAVVETMRGHNLGRVYYEGSALPDTGIPGNVGGYSKERVIHAPSAGIFHAVCKITDRVHAGQIIGIIENEKDKAEVCATIDGLLRGCIRDGYPVTKGFKIADIDPRISEYENCFTISDKARCIAGGVLEVVMHLSNV